MDADDIIFAMNPIRAVILVWIARPARSQAADEGQ
jgi:hypothetical protein